MINTAVDIIFNILSALVDLLPVSPFIVMCAKIDDIEFLGFLNYFIPFDNCLSLLEIWLVSVGIYLVVKNMRQIVDFFKGLIG
ncbi:hypothetical protein [Lactonifactor longoviformis]|uniref:hypothetical protein n=1 Tax=Lactonifactor longoviformis TaxID=341220 RepID=UPI001D034ED2|nr:hypothetical protein [Lactonifactor longoviformis]MCB5712131.1 hypothetical protein [Lactonifactor longoviformis]MCB5716175.1 hypothetical protein [Lactonifactor longoviformis]